MNADRGYEAADNIRNCPNRRTTVLWPEPIHAKLGELVASVKETGGDTSKSELAAALIAFTDTDGEALCDLLRSYRTAKVGDVLPEAES
jgi:hypothetical protein